jgi:acylphosphatase
LVYVALQGREDGKKKRCLRPGSYGLIMAWKSLVIGPNTTGGLRPVMVGVGEGADMNRVRMEIVYTGRVQGVGFRYTVKSLVPGFEVTGAVRNLADGRVELIAEGTREELEAFHAAIMDCGLGRLIRETNVRWGEATGGFRGFEIIG